MGVKRQLHFLSLGIQGWMASPLHLSSHRQRRIIVLTIAMLARVTRRAEISKQLSVLAGILIPFEWTS